MTKDELMKAFQEQTPVCIDMPGAIGYDSVLAYRRISAVIYRCLKDGRFIMQAEIEDMESCSVTIVNPDQLKGA